ncbi:Group 1 glycosyl transferase [Mesorhizobium prunaredense]|uniref:Group 1 glycosyl transferase n=1 Tax=Mesorhizobium prunaredense TaxID=1631249 RepID=A0A1R3VDZ9_9HYPH|nr:glycosyltransferase family 4 protein [Mesorhizobium prunaredense]SIT58128.1 Group 1 glycosyl transferase [Mesorhizobium prunaredense]
MHILFLSDNFPPEVNAPASRTFEHCREWVAAGHQVTVVTCAPNFPRGKVFGGYKNRLWQTETMEGIKVVRVWTLISANEGFLWRTLDYVSFLIAAILAAPFTHKADVVVATSPQFFTAFAGYVVGLLKRAPFVFELRDLWPESIRAVGALREGRLLSMLERIEMFLYRKAAAIVCVTHSFRRILAERGIDPAKVEIVTNGADLANFRPRPKDAELEGELGLQGKFVCGYIGTHGMAHGLHTLLEAGAKIAARGETELCILMLGDGALKTQLKVRAAELGLSNVVFLDTVPKAEVGRYWSLLDLSIIHLKKDNLFQSVIPSKMFESMAMGIPIIMGVKGEAADIINFTQTGVVIEPEDAEALALAILRLRDDPRNYRRMHQNCSIAAERYSRPALAANMLAILESIAKANGSRTATDQQRADGK